MDPGTDVSAPGSPHQRICSATNSKSPLTAAFRTGCGSSPNSASTCTDQWDDRDKPRGNSPTPADDPPFASGDGVLFGLQSRHVVDDPLPASMTTEFHTTIDVVRPANSGVDFAGEHIHGRRGDRFIYLAWGNPDPTEPFVMFARAKIRLDSIPADLLDVSVDSGQPLIAELQASNAKAQPASGTIKPSSIDWHTR